MSNSIIAPRWIKALLCGGAFLCACNLHGQEFLNSPLEKGPAPQPPVIQQSEAVAYTATFNYFPGAQPPSPQPKALIVEKVGEIRHDIRQWTDAPQTELWMGGPVGLEKGTDAFGNPNGVHAIQLMERATAFPELAWVGKANFAGVIRESERTIDVYRLEGMTLDWAPFSFNKDQVFVYVDDATRLPLALKTARYSVTYNYGKPPARLDMPDEYQKVYVVVKERLEHPPTPP